MADHEIRCAASARPTNIFRIVIPIAAVVLCFCSICTYVLIDARRAAWERAAETGASLVAAIESDIVRNIESLNLSLEGVLNNLKHPDIDRIDAELRQMALFDHSASAVHFGAILVLDETGHLRFDSRHAKPTHIDLSDRDYFKAHKEMQSAILYVGQPQASRKTGTFFVGISRRLSKPDGSFNGVVAGTIQLNYFKNLFKKITVGPGGNITLAHTDGTILMRWPFDESVIGHNIKRAELYKHLSESPKGRFETNAVTDGVRRLVAYSQVSDLPIVIGVGQATDDIYAQWYSYAWTIGLLVAALCALSALLSIHLMRDLKRRDAMERKLVTLVTTDGLTGVSNRWHFNETIRREWQRARRDQSNLALLMIDADEFKTYNDRHGHRAGDDLLRAIGRAVSDSIRPGIDLGARFGGDEFAVLLPETPVTEAARVADQIRERLVTDCRERGTDDDVRISVGVACLVPDKTATYTALLEAADAALYRAKQRGRNRIELAEIEFASSTQASLPVLECAA